jgi:hypothetical protein
MAPGDLPGALPLGPRLPLVTGATVGPRPQRDERARRTCVHALGSGCEGAFPLCQSRVLRDLVGSGPLTQN